MHYGIALEVSFFVCYFNNVLTPRVFVYNLLEISGVASEIKKCGLKK